MFLKRLEDFAASLRTACYTSSQASLTEEKAFLKAHTLLCEAREREGIVYVIGNGGSAGIASHFSNDLMKALQIPSQTLYDSNLMTCLANDLGYENVFSYPLQQILKEKDLLVAISSSGQSRNILNAAQVAKEKGTPLLTLSGFRSTNPLRPLGELNVWIDRLDYGLVESAHFFWLHTLVDLWNTQVKKYAEPLRTLPSR